MLAAHCVVVLTHLLLMGVPNDLPAKGTSGSAGRISKPGHCELVIGQVTSCSGNGDNHITNPFLVCSVGCQKGGFCRVHKNKAVNT